MGSTLQLTLSMEENMIGPITLREFVRRRHWEDQFNLAPAFIKREWPPPPYNRVTDEASVCCAVSTTELSTVMILSKGAGSEFTRNTFSADEGQPWLISQNLKVNKRLSDHISALWSEKEIHQDGNPDLVNQIAEHTVYECINREEGKWRCLPIVADENNVIRFATDDFVMWSHPPRDEPLRTVLRENDDFNQAVGDLKQLSVRWNTILHNPTISDDRRPGAQAAVLDQIRTKFAEVYKFYEDRRAQNRLPSSYKWPTLQLGVTNGDRIQRYGETFAGVYERNEDKVHHKFAALNVEARALPSEEEVFNGLLPSGIELTLANVMADQNQG